MKPHGPGRGSAALELVSDRPGDSDGSTWTCPECERVLGLRTSAIVRITRNARIRLGRVARGSGTQVWACACCLGRGVVTRAGA